MDNQEKKNRGMQAMPRFDYTRYRAIPGSLRFFHVAAVFNVFSPISRLP
jgi:hypothetical protein